MPKNKKSSPAEDIVEIVAVLPWWAGMALAFIFYCVLHSMASTPVVPMAGNPAQIEQLLVGTVEKSLASVGQYLLPLLCLIGAAVSAWQRQARRQLIDKVVEGVGSTALKEMRWQEFELLVGEAFRLRGYAVVENGGGGADGGVDLVLRKDGEKFLVQCKQWKSWKVGVTVIRELYGVMAADGATGGFVVTCGQFTEEARAFTNGRNIRLIDGSELEKMIRQTRATDPHCAPAPTPVNPDMAVPSCPNCSGFMVVRTARRGANAGKKFWGCPAYPSCRGIVSMNPQRN